MNPVLWKTFKNGEFKKQRNFYPNKVANLQKCPVSVVTFDSFYMSLKKNLNGGHKFEGFDGEILNSISKKMNFIVNLTNMDDFNDLKFGYVYLNGSSGGAIKNVIHFM